MPGPPEQIPTLGVGAAIIRVSTAIGASTAQSRHTSDLTAAQLQVLRLALPGCSVGFVVGRLATPKSTVTSVVDQLAASGLVSRAADPADRRRQIIAATPRGAKLLATFDADLADRVGMLASAVPSAQRARLSALLARLPDPIGPFPAD